MPGRLEIVAFIVHEQGFSTEASVETDSDERWKELCAQAAVEYDPTKFWALSKGIYRLLEEKEPKTKSNNDALRPAYN